VYSSKFQLRSTDEVDALITLAKKCPNVREFPTDLQKHFIGPLVRVCNLKRRALKTECKMRVIWDSLDIVNEMPNIDEEVLDMVRDSLVKFFKEHPKEMEDLAKNKVACVPVFLKLFAGIQKQVSEMKREHEKEVEALKSEIRQLRGEAEE
jgi:hypothetical protein